MGDALELLECHELLTHSDKKLFLNKSQSRAFAVQTTNSGLTSASRGLCANTEPNMPRTAHWTTLQDHLSLRCCKALYYNRVYLGVI